MNVLKDSLEKFWYDKVGHVLSSFFLSHSMNISIIANCKVIVKAIADMMYMH